MIIWQRIPPPEVYEKRYSYRFCRNLTQQATGEELLLMAPDTRLKDITLSRASKEDNYFLCVNYPEVVVSKTALDVMKKNLFLHQATAVGPVMNSSPFPQQETSIPFRYFDLSTFNEAVDTIAGDKETLVLETEELDPACLLIPNQILSTLPKETEISNIHQHLKGKKIAALGAFIHRYPDYFSAERPDLVEFVTPDAKRILDLGCAKGGYGRTLKQLRPDIFLVGVEQDKDMAEAARHYYDLVIQEALEDADLPDDFDLVNLGDVLEHLVYPWEILSKMNSLLRPGGYVVGSVPNIGHWTVVRNLLRGQFEYVPIGLLCVGHLRFFTESSLIESLREAGFEIDELKRDMTPPSPQGQRFIQRVVSSGYGDEQSLKTNEFIFRARKART